jgi:dephospho-CoA kinase
MKKMHEDEIALLRAEKSELRDQIEDNEGKAKEMKKQFEEELKKKEDKLKSEAKP